MNVIKKYRLISGMTQAELGRMMRVSNISIVSQWEVGKTFPSAKHIKRLIDVLHIPADEMIAWLEEIAR